MARLNALVARQRRELDKLRSAAAARSVVDLARGMLMEQLGCTPAEAQRQLARLAAESGVTTTELAAQITHQDPPGGPAGPGMPSVSLARAAIETAASGNAVASALLGEALGGLGAVAVAIWLTEPDGGLELAGEAGFGSHEASRWRRLHPDMPSLPQQVARDGLETWWPAGPPPGDERPLPGRWRDGAWAGLPLHDAGVALGAMVVCWPEPATEFPGPLRRQLTSVADVAAQALGIRLSQGDLPADYEAAGVLALLDDLFDECVFARAVRDPGGRVTDFRVDHVSDGFRDPAGRGAADLTGRHLLELYPEALTAGGLFDRCLAALEGGEPQRLPEAVAAQAAPGTPAFRNPDRAAVRRRRDRLARGRRRRPARGPAAARTAPGPDRRLGGGRPRRRGELDRADVRAVRAATRGPGAGRGPAVARGRRGRPRGPGLP